MNRLTIVLAVIMPVLLNAQNVLIKNGTVLTITKGVKENSDILVTNGKIYLLQTEQALSMPQVCL